MPIEFPRAGWVEQDAVAIWRSVEDAIDDVPRHRRRCSAVAAVAVTNQRESVLLWDRATGSPIGPVIVWQCRRTTDFCETLRDAAFRRISRRVTGLTIDPAVLREQAALAARPRFRARWRAPNVASSAPERSTAG